ncbi:hypothetical protein OIDMADRAFT_23563 [Oidiodendron maius Zn]|uniref:DUF6594 domain-containing protein n=1 Tax=Oidiodendron maius (strain Zn) TaxID=913774 RepID=A0A0C3I336_OIDMZ|nr:hypothetical protein OIDMADRAFT_23563 [Oidiodendron maius Zn]
MDYEQWKLTMVVLCFGTDDILLKDSSLRALAPALARDHLSVFNWIYAEKPLDVGQYDFIYHRDDFVSLPNKPQEGFDDLIKAFLNRSPGSRIQQFFKQEPKTPHQHAQESQKQEQIVYLFSNDKISLFAQMIAICLVVAILLIPIFLLFLTEMSRKTTSVMVLVFVLAFAVSMSLMGAKAESVFVGTCTYCAVLVTFLGNLQGAATVVVTASA